MKIKKAYQRVLSNLIFPPTTIARFGPARLVRLEWPSARRGRHELIGGTDEHRAAAREWCSHFAPEIVFAAAARPQAAARRSVAVCKDWCPTGRSRPARPRLQQPTLATAMT